MGQQSSHDDSITNEEKEEAHKLAIRVENEGPEAIAQHIKENLDRWKKEDLKVGICGRTKTGKSTFINAVLGLRATDTGAAKSGYGNTTQYITPYPHPRNEKIFLVDFPGVGTEDHPRSTYMKNVYDARCDYMTIFLESVVTEDDIWLAERFNKINKPFCFVRSKIDIDIYNAEFDGKNPDTVLEEIREKVQATVAASSATRSANVFFISGRYTDVGDFSQLLSHMEKCLPSMKFESILFSVTAISKDVIERKYLKLQKRVKILSVAAALISAEPIPVIDLVINVGLIIYELKHYMKTFGLTSDQIENLPEDVKKRLNVMNMLKKGDKELGLFIAQQIGKLAAIAVVQSILELYIPFIGAIISSPTTFYAVYTFLNKSLDGLREDAIIVYDNNLRYAQRQLRTAAQHS